ncbi:pyridoxal phosphate-dependent aminotransferase, partial [Halorubrum sp. Atlit-8R]
MTYGTDCEAVLMTTTFPAIPYLEWISGRASEATHDLATSDLNVARHDDS